MKNKLTNKNINSIKLFGIDVSFPGYDMFFNILSNCLNKRERIIVNYCNANTIRLINKNHKFLSILNNSSIVHADGIGIYFAAKWLTKNKIERFNWTDYADRFLKECCNNGWSIFFLGSDQITLDKMRQELEVKYPDLKITGLLNGFNDVNNKTVEIINKTLPDILWVGMSSPKQEEWIYENFSNLNAIIIQSVGGLFDFLAGSRFRGTEFIRKVGLEWLIRVFQHPTKYFNRYILGIPIFFYILVKEKFKYLFIKLT